MIRRAPRGGGVCLGFLLAAGALALAPGAEAGPPRPRVLVLVVDAVPFEVAADFVEQHPGAFPGAHPPAALISTFPSDTPPAMSALFGDLGMGRPPGYEVRYYDWSRGQRRGGDPITWHTYPYPHHGFFHWRLRGIELKALAYGFPRTFNRVEAKHAVAAFLESDAPVYFAYVTSTDASGHSYGEAAHRRALAIVAAQIEQARKRTAPFYVVLLSDHGMSAGTTPLRNLRRPIQRALALDGWRPRHRIRAPVDVVQIVQGLVSSVVLYAEPGTERALAATVTGVDGVDFCAFRSSALGTTPPDPYAPAQTWTLRSGRGESRIDRRGEGASVVWRYRALDVDELGYRSWWPVAPGGEPVWLSDEQVLMRTALTRYPDAPHRVAAAFEEVENPASVLCSLEPDSMHGAAAAQVAHALFFEHLRRTHGSLERRASVGFLITDHPGWSGARVVRAEAALDFLQSEASPPLEAGGEPTRRAP